MRWSVRLPGVCALASLLLFSGGMPGRAVAQSFTEYQLKAGVLYNFIALTTWPEPLGGVLNVCVYGPDPFAGELGKLAGKKVGDLRLAVLSLHSASGLARCQVVFVSQPVLGNLPRVLDEIGLRPVLTVADAPGGNAGVALNMELEQGRVKFQANLPVARAAGLLLSSKLLRLASEVIQ